MKKNTARNILIGFTVLWLLAIFPCGWLGVFSVFLTDSGDINPIVFAMIFYGLFGFPAVGVVGAIAAWVLYRKEKYRAAVVAVLSPLWEALIPILGFLLLGQ